MKKEEVKDQETTWRFETRLLFAATIINALVLITLLFTSFNGHSEGVLLSENEITDCHSGIPLRATAVVKNVKNDPSSAGPASSDMVRIPSGTFSMGGDNDQARPDEFPKHDVTVDSFWMDTHEVTNAEFAQFVKATGYVTIAERKPDWEELKKQLPPGSPKPSDDLLIAASVVFTPPTHPVQLINAAQWWSWVAGASWKHPEGEGSDIRGKDNMPVVHVAWDDAVAYANWAGKRLPTEAEWEWAARGGKKNAVYPWGDENVDAGKVKANSWQGRFPDNNTVKDGHYSVADVKSFAPNAYGLFDMSGNVWEWCSDWYRDDYYEELKRSGGAKNPAGPSSSFDPMEPTVPKRVVRGGSFLCNDSYCSGYRVAARMKASPDTGLSHTGFRCVKDK